MSRFFSLFLIIFILSAMLNQAWCFNGSAVKAPEPSANDSKEAIHNEWLKTRFSKQHQALIPVVLVADMFVACNESREVDKTNYSLSYLINEMDKNLLAEKLGQCLGKDDIQSDVAINFGLLGCFQAQLSQAGDEENSQKMAIVKQAIASLSLAEREKTLTQCVTEQSIDYLK